MVRKKHKILYWLPRVLAIFFMIVMLVSTIGIFGEGFSWLSLAVHLGLVLLVGVVTIIAWRLELYGGFLFIVLSIFYLILTYDSQSLTFSMYLVIPVSLFIIGSLFILNKAIRQGEKDLMIV